MMVVKGRSWAVVLGRQTHCYVLCINNTTAPPAARQTYRAAGAVKNGSTYYGKARLKCKQCGRQFVQMRTYQPVSNECKHRIELMLAERISLQGICRVMEVAAHQLYTYMDELYGETPADLGCSVVNHSTDIELVMLDS